MQSVLPLGPQRASYLSLREKQSLVIKKLKNAEHRYFESLDEQMERATGTYPGSARDNSALDQNRAAESIRLPQPKPKPVGGAVAQAIPFNKIRILKQSDEDYQRDREELGD